KLVTLRGSAQGDDVSELRADAHHLRLEAADAIVQSRLEVWMQPLTTLRAPKLFNLRSDPFERAQHEAGDYVRWFVEHAFVLVPPLAAHPLEPSQDCPPRQKPGSCSVDQATEKLRNPPSSN